MATVANQCGFERLWQIETRRKKDFFFFFVSFFFKAYIPTTSRRPDILPKRIRWWGHRQSWRSSRHNHWYVNKSYDILRYNASCSYNVILNLSFGFQGQLRTLWTHPKTAAFLACGPTNSHNIIHWWFLQCDHLQTYKMTTHHHVSHRLHCTFYNIAVEKSHNDASLRVDTYKMNATPPRVTSNALCIL